MPTDAAPEPSPLTGRHKKRGHYKPKNGLDGFLFELLGGKYRKKRYEILRGYLRSVGLPDQEIENTIAWWQRGGVISTVRVAPNRDLRGSIVDYQDRLQREKRRIRALKANKIGWRKRRRRAKDRERREMKTASKHLKTAPKHLNPAVKHPKPAR